MPFVYRALYVKIYMGALCHKPHLACACPPRDCKCTQHVHQAETPQPMTIYTPRFTTTGPANLNVQSSFHTQEADFTPGLSADQQWKLKSTNYTGVMWYHTCTKIISSLKRFKYIRPHMMDNCPGILKITPNLYEKALIVVHRDDTAGVQALARKGPAVFDSNEPLHKGMETELKCSHHMALYSKPAARFRKDNGCAAI